MANAHPQQEPAVSKPQVRSLVSDTERTPAASSGAISSPLFGNVEACVSSPHLTARLRSQVETRESPDGPEHTALLRGKGSYTSTLRLALSNSKSFQILKDYRVPATIEDMNPALQATCRKAEPMRTADFTHLQFQVRTSMRAEHEALQFLLHQKPQCVVQVDSLHLKADEQLTVRMQYAHGGNLRTFLGSVMQIMAKKESAAMQDRLLHLKIGEFGVTEETCIRIMRQVLLGLSCLHDAEEACIQHRDLCADNCLVMEALPDGTVADPLEYRTLLSAAFSPGNPMKLTTRRLAEVHLAKSFGGIVRLEIPQIHVRLCDFNISHGHLRREEGAGSLFTAEKDNEVSNRWQYLAPEHRNGRVPDAVYADRGDVWSAAMMMLELLGGWSRAHKTFDTFSRAFSSAPITGLRSKLPHSLPSHLSPALRDLLENMLQPNPQHRPSVVQVLAHPSFNQHSGIPVDPVPSFFASYRFSVSTVAIVHSGDEFPRNVGTGLSGATHIAQPSILLPVVERSQTVAGTEYTTSTIARTMRTYPIAACCSALQQCQRNALYAMIAKLTYMNEKREAKALGTARLSARSDAWNALVGHYSGSKYAINVRAYVDEPLINSCGNMGLICDEKQPPNLPFWIRRVAAARSVGDCHRVRLSEKLARGIIYHAAQMLHLLELNHTDRKPHGSLMPSSLHIIVPHHLEAALTFGSAGVASHGTASSTPGQDRTIEAPTDWFNLRTPSAVRIQTSDCGYYYIHMLMGAHATRPQNIKRAWLHSTCVSYLSPQRLRAIVGNELALEYISSLQQQQGTPTGLAEIFWSECTRMLHSGGMRSGWSLLAYLLQTHITTLRTGYFGLNGATKYARICFTRVVQACADSAEHASAMEPLLRACLRDLASGSWHSLCPEDILLQHDPDSNELTVLELSAQRKCFSVLESLCAAVQLQPQDLMARTSTHWNVFELVLQKFAFEDGPGLSEQQMRCLDILSRSHASGEVHKMFILKAEISTTRLCDHCTVPSVDALLACNVPRELLTAISLDYLAHVEGHIMECASDDAEPTFREYVYRLASCLQPPTAETSPLGGGPVATLTPIYQSNAPEEADGNQVPAGPITASKAARSPLEDPLSMAHASIISNISAVLVDVWNSGVATTRGATAPSPCALKLETLTRSQRLHQICLRTNACHNHRVVASRPVHVTKSTQELFQRFLECAGAQLSKCDAEACQLARAIQESASVEDDMYALGMILASLLCGSDTVEGLPGCPPTVGSFAAYAISPDTPLLTDRRYPETIPVMSDAALTVLRYLLYASPKRTDIRTWLDTEKWFASLWTDKPAASVKKWLACTGSKENLDRLLLQIKMSNLTEPAFEGYYFTCADQETLRAMAINDATREGVATLKTRLTAWLTLYDGIVCDYQTSTTLFPSLRLCGFSGHLLATTLPRETDSLKSKRKPGVLVAYGISACATDAHVLRAEIRKAIGFGMSDSGIKFTSAESNAASAAASITAPIQPLKTKEAVAAPVVPIPLARAPGGLPVVAPLGPGQRLPTHSAGVSALRQPTKVEKVEPVAVTASIAQPGSSSSAV